MYFQPYMWMRRTHLRIYFWPKNLKLQNQKERIWIALFKWWNQFQKALSTMNRQNGRVYPHLRYTNIFKGKEEIILSLFYFILKNSENINSFILLGNYFILIFLYKLNSFIFFYFIRKLFYFYFILCDIQWEKILLFY